MLIKRNGHTIPHVMLVVSIVALLVVISMPFYNRIHAEARIYELSILVTQFEKIMKDMYLEQGEYPPAGPMPFGLANSWAAPTNLQNVAELEQTILKRCGFWMGELLPGGRTDIACFYTAPEDGQTFTFHMQQPPPGGMSFLAMPGDKRFTDSLDSWADAPVSDACFLPGTLITLADGDVVPIERMKVGDQVKSYNAETSEFSVDTVTQVFVHPDGHDGYLEINDLKVTSEHPLWVQDKGWVRAGDVVMGDLLMKEDKSFVLVTHIQAVTDEYTVYKRHDPRRLSHAEAHEVDGTMWTDTDSESASIVYYRIE